jgi:hypothetical protein
MSNSIDVFKKLIIDEADAVKEDEKLVNSASSIFQIENPSGRIKFKNFGNLTDKQRIAAFLVAKFVAAKTKIIISDSFGIAEIAKELGRPVTNLSGPIRDLIKQGFVDPLPDKKYRIMHHRISEVFETIFATIKRS